MADGVRVEVEAGELDGDVAGARPLLDAAQAVAVAAAYVEDAERVGEGGQWKRVEPIEQGAVGEEPAVGPGDIAEAGAQFVAGARLIHSVR